MSDFLVFQLYGAMAAWGDIAVGEQRPTTPHPSKSAVLGLIAAALGIQREADDQHAQLAENYGFAVRLDRSGVMLRDYHTIQKTKNTNKLKHLYSRRDELVDKDNLATVLSSRDYRCDGFYTLCLWQKDNPPHSLETLQKALAKPRFTLYLGRKSCPLALPIRAKIIAADTLSAAFQSFDTQQDEIKAFINQHAPTDFKRTGQDCYWEDTQPHGTLKPLHTTPRNDHPLSRKRRQFSKRDEHYGQLQGE